MNFQEETERTENEWMMKIRFLIVKLSRNHAVEPGCFDGGRELKPTFSGTRSRRGATPERSRGFQPTEKGNRGFSVAERRLT
jgi:hypothetical protein